ncbi:DNA primase [Salpingoeca rosetta]|uniref:DNA primase n=1 Tax=Salpingoeca rosetta (strain ATCC 50818 / BSB-021) TaxID=946362 RepID=F2UAH6_SALR5|nr:DNA primase [Salpingoeca rosetta]EGD73392.1 DNA primase [Salpingoeca rosetta]|eukprot:XP_004993674.1 DNA primase [Salpingoeca rosetta]
MSDGDFPQLLQQYYARLFPYTKYFRWLSYGSTDKVFQNREFSFTLKDDVYVRYQSFTDLADLKQAIQAKCPYKIDIGAVYTTKPKDHKKVKASEFYPVQKELVFDIDMTDYDEIRTCCSGAAICHKCWPFMTAALKVLDKALREDFGFQHLLWVYSGRRGIHCWVCDERARMLTQEGRGAVAEYLQLVSGSDQMACKVHVPPSYPAATRAFDILKPYFHSTVLSADGQDLLNHAEQRRALLGVFEDSSMTDDLESRWTGDTRSSEHKWADVEKAAKAAKKRSKLQAITLQHTYPRLDIHVSKGLNHLLKSPFVVHPKTGRVCVPIDPETADSFDPLAVPTIQQLLTEFDDLAEQEQDNKEGAEVGLSSL